MANFVLELLSEEIPSRMQKNASKHLENEFIQKISEIGLKYEKIRSFYSSRRLTIIVEEIELYSEEIEVEKLGPRVDAPKIAIDGFLRSCGAKSTKDCTIINDKKGDRYQFTQKIPSKFAPEILPVIITEIITKFPWPKSMRWGNGSLRWVRPLRNILALIFDKTKIILVDFDIDDISSNNYTYGHRFLKNNQISIKSINNYLEELHKNYVMLDVDDRKNEILSQLEQIERRYDLKILMDEDLLDEVSGLVEWPIVHIGNFEEAFLELPKEVLITSMKSHQKYFSVVDNKTGKITNKFILVSNIDSMDKGKFIINGNERVLSARLYDAKYFWDRDNAQPLIEKSELLENVTFHKQIGTLSNKIERIGNIAHKISTILNIKDENIILASKLIKNDLLTEMVGEFPELQGVMGRYYALNQGYDKSVCDAISEHYLPNSPQDKVPTNYLSYILSLADKLDNLVCFWSIGEKPTGSKDPYALRRSGNGIIRNIIVNNLDLNFDHLIEELFIETNICNQGDARSLSSDLVEFLVDRFRTLLSDQQIDIQISNAIIAADKTSNFYRINSKIKMINDFVQTTEGKELFRSLNRIKNIIDGDYLDTKFEDISVNLFQKEEENNLYTGIQKLTKQNIKSDDINEAKNFLYQLSILTPEINNFFDNVVVNHEDEKIKTNRINLLASVLFLLQYIVDLKLVDIK
ncbi:MAG: glycine--tRNA ligase subunit beta [Rhizobiales bacterium]|nr:glycine--tRNA ligase subunit beta [Hyphomicrobiales bacterium]